jgi:hypothetical protein
MTVVARPPVGAAAGVQDCSLVTALAIGDGYAYVGTGSRLTIFDIRDPAAPVAVGRSEGLPGPIQDIAVTGPLAVLALGDAGLAIVETADPRQPRVASLAAGPVDRLAVAGPRVYTVGDPQRIMSGNPPVFQVIDLADPEDPFRVRSVEGVEGEASDLVVAGGYAYVVGYQPTLSVLDVTELASPRRVRTRDVSRVWGHSAAIAEPGRLYVSASNFPLLIFDVSDPAQARLLFPELGNPMGSRILQGTSGWTELVLLPDAHLAHLGRASGPNFAHLLSIVNVADPSRPTEVGAYRLAWPTGRAGAPDRWRMATAGSYLFVASWAEGLQVIDLSDPRAPTPIWSDRCL